ncbi:hypothetical protein LAG90_10465 [Marinilongibacter aquaticus]|uniref:hypothetical protein n=1 Tax=Marinilongibacter aquaticus TaxID=2975157 RepID=UPI0021BD1EE2|nr:hypothetical protein [Marinilongibacter aquaticus]UBM57244.1 hypothetical protein LAG90_10465 [Marinilongibacter aquaticus]
MLILLTTFYLMLRGGKAQYKDKPVLEIVNERVSALKMKGRRFLMCIRGARVCE